MSRFKSLLVMLVVFMAGCAGTSRVSDPSGSFWVDDRLLTSEAKHLFTVTDKEYDIMRKQFSYDMETSVFSDGGGLKWLTSKQQMLERRDRDGVIVSRVASSKPTLISFHYYDPETGLVLRFKYAVDSGAPDTKSNVIFALADKDIKQKLDSYVKDPQNNIASLKEYFNSGNQKTTLPRMSNFGDVVSNGNLWIALVNMDKNLNANVQQYFGNDSAKNVLAKFDALVKSQKRRKSHL